MSGSSGKWLHIVGSVSLISAGILFILASVAHFLFLLGPPLTSEQFLVFVASHKVLFQTVDVAFVIGSFLLILSILVLYRVLRATSNAKLKLALGVSAVASFLLLASSINFYSLVGLSDLHEVAGTDVLRAEYSALAGAVIAFYNWVGILLSGIIFSGAVLVVCFLVGRKRLGGIPFYLGIIAGSIGFVGSIPLPGLQYVALLSLVIFAFWFFAVAISMNNLARKST